MVRITGMRMYEKTDRMPYKLKLDNGSKSDIPYQFIIDSTIIFHEHIKDQEELHGVPSYGIFTMMVTKPIARATRGDYVTISVTRDGLYYDYMHVPRWSDKHG